MSLTIDALSSAAANWSIEVTPNGASKVESFADALEPETHVNVTFLPGSDPVDTYLVAKRLHDEGMIPIPHIAARSIKDRKHLEKNGSPFCEPGSRQESLEKSRSREKPNR